MRAGKLHISTPFIPYLVIAVACVALFIAFAPVAIIGGQPSLTTADAVVDLGWFGKYCFSGDCTLGAVSADCQAGKGCNEDELTILGIISRCGGGANDFLWKDTMFFCSGEQVKQSAQAEKILEAQPTNCTASLTNWAPIFTPTCWMRVVSAGVAAVLIQAGAFFLAIAGYLFNTLTQYTIVEFGKTYAMIKGGVEVGWSAFRDIVNIVIIGVFTFIAISIILGIEKYGQKKLIAHVLIIAVLLNFSLLFTKLIIDGSNFTALQMYNAMPDIRTGSQSQAAATGPNPIQGFVQEGIAGQFVNLIGMSSFQDSYALLRNKADKNDDTLSTFVYGIGSAVLLFVAASVLLYGCYIIGTRAILLIFLILTSPIAFASYLIPGTENRSMGWNTWWTSLLSAAVLAPLLMTLLWATLAIGRALKRGLEATGGGIGTLGDLMASPAKTDNLEALFMYVLLLGLLYKCFQLSHDFSTGIMRFDLTGGILGKILGGPLALTSQLGGALGRRFLGSSFAWRAESVGKDLQAAQNAYRQPGGGTRKNFERMTKLARMKSRREALADSSYNFMNTAAGKAAAKAAGLTGILSGADARGASFAANIKAKTEAAQKKADSLALSEKQKNEIRDDAARAHLTQSKATKEGFEAQREELRKQTRIQEEAGKQQIETLKKQRDVHTSEIDKEKQGEKDLLAKHEAILKSIAEEISKTRPDTTARADMERRHAEAIRQRDIEMKGQTQKIEAARQRVAPNIADIDAQIKTTEAPLAELRTKLAQVESNLENYTDTKMEERARTHATNAVSEAVGKMQEVAGEIGRREAGPIGRMLGDGELIARGVRKKFKEKADTANLRSVFESMRSETGGAKESGAAEAH